MTKEQFLFLLRAELTGRMPEEELEDILRYYNEYFEDAGPEREREVMTELGSPERLARKILGEAPPEEEGPADSASGYVGEPVEVEYQPAGGLLPPWAFCIIASIVAIPILPGIFGLVTGLVGAGIICIVVGVVLGIAGMAISPLATKLCLVGAGLAVIAVGMLLAAAGVNLARLAVKVILKVCRRLWNRFVLGEEDRYE